MAGYVLTIVFLGVLLLLFLQTKQKAQIYGIGRLSGFLIIFIFMFVLFNTSNNGCFKPI